MRSDECLATVNIVDEAEISLGPCISENAVPEGFQQDETQCKDQCRYVENTK